MGAPVYEGMPQTNRVFNVGKWGEIRCGGPCKDDYGRLVVVHRNGDVIRLQKAALEAFQAAQKAVGNRITLTGSFRSCSYQTALYRSDSGRFADPDTSAHCRGLAIDVSTNQGSRDLAAIHKALLARDWHQARPTDEPWHFSFGIKC